ncbi:hypothetical protein JGH11_19215 [Dysgonomonas sp. Marseille-P4677]|uniref:hypothetical protein n=1 Tax=Dysgonomonas sp. Marseille-P4677 TaxID=2364790 RepID=UPI001912EF6B|nr:hypothetical protein [Dysgonomonas sp. Marseille-P4677]MBK5723002.1 hypothetical protein [Dysgonomonas sp. Marseille-P4677]
MKAKILEALKTKYKTLGLGESAFSGVAEILEKTITDETQIETAVAGVEAWLKVAQGEGDRVRNDKAKQAQSTTAQTAQPQTNAPTVTPNAQTQAGGNNQDDLATIIAKAVEAATKPITDKLASIETDKVVNSRKSILESALKGAPEAYRNSMLSTFEFMNFSDDDSFNKYVEQTKTTATDLSLAASSSRPYGGARVPSKEASQAECDKIVNKIISKM